MFKRFALAALMAAAPLAAAAMPPAGTYSYSIHHPDHGDIGTYTNTIRVDGNGVTVDTSVRIAVGIGPVTLYREEADRREEWRDGRLVAYSSKTVKNGKDREVSGRAEGDAFVVRRPGGTVERAPAEIWPMNPWSPDIAGTKTVLASASGKIYPARVVDAGAEAIRTSNGEISAHRYRVTADDKSYDVWFDAQDRLTKFTAPQKDATVTFTLKGVR